MKVIFAVDSPACLKPFVEFAAKQKWEQPVSFKLINVVEPLLVGSYMAVFPSPFLEDVRADMFKRGNSIMAELAEEMRRQIKDVEVTKQSIEGFPAQTIAREAKEWPADLIVTGTHGRAGFERVLVGSIAADIAGQAPCSVLVLNLKTEGKESANDSKTEAQIGEAQPSKC